MQYTLIPTLLAAATLKRGTLAAPLPQSDMSMPQIYACPEGEREAEYRNVQEERYDGEPELVTGASCRTLKDGSCTLGKLFSWAKYVLRTLPDLIYHSTDYGMQIDPPRTASEGA